MNRPQYIISWQFLPIFFGLVFFFVLPIIIGFVLPFVTKDYSILLVLLIPLLCGTVIFVSRKFFFAKIFIDNDGVKLLYKKIIQRQINWQEMKKVLVQKSQLSFHKTSDDKIWLTKNFIAFDVMRNYHENPELESICQVINANKSKLETPIEFIKAEPRLVNLLK